jgi:DNA-binding SARP family transcriptional activator/TolB-like protein
LTTFGSVRVCTTAGGDVDSLIAQPRRVALLVYLALTQPRGFHRRDTLLALFWPEYDEQRARNALSQAVHFLRRALGAEVIVSGADDQLRVDPELVWCDVLAFDAALDAGQTSDALEFYRGPFLEGFHFSGAAAELDRWVDTERDRLGRRYARALQQMADEREAAGDHAGAVAWHRQLAAHDPLSSRAALGLIRALAAGGETAGAIQHARVHETLLRAELQAPADAAISAFVRELQARDDRRTPTMNERSSPNTVAVTPPAAHMPAPPPNAGVSVVRRWRAKQVGLALAGMLVVFLAFLPLTSGTQLAATPRIGCIAVLPIENLSRDSALEYFADALTDAAITELAHYEQPRVISRSSVMQFKRARKPLPEIGRALNCDGIIAGSITRVGPVIHMDAQLLYAPADRHLWAQSYEQDTSRTLVLERQVVDAVARHVQLLTGIDARVAPPSRRVEPVVHQLYLRGRDAFRSRNAASLRQAAALYQKAIALDTSFALPYAGLADVYRFFGGLGFGPVSYRDSARAMAVRALALDSTASEAHTSMAAILADHGDWTHAEAEFRRAIELQPANALAHHWYAMLLAALDRREEALGEIRRAKDLDPMSEPINGLKLQIDFFAGVRAPLGNPGNPRGMVDPTYPSGHMVRGIALARKGRCPEAYAANRRAQELAPDNTLMMIGLVGVQLLCGDSTRAHALLKEVERRPDARLMALYIAPLYAEEHKLDSAFAWLDQSQWQLQTFYDLRVNPNLEPLRSDPRYAQLLRRLRLSQ